jgi:APA family basic amino acid/polyamine antiporter
MAETVARADSRPGELVRGLSLLDATTLVLGSVIGSGIFFAPSIMAGYLQSPGLLLGLWVIGGFMTLVGALCYGELAAAYPRAGGQYVFLSEAFSPIWGFLYGWTFLLAINTGFVAAVSVAFAKTIGFFLPGIGEAQLLFTIGRFSFSTAQAVALVVVASLTWLNVTGLRTGAFVQNVFTIAKVAAVAVLVVLAIATGRGSVSNFTPLGGLELGAEGLKVGLFAALAGAMAKALFSYDAWQAITLAAEEVKDPDKNLHRSLILGTLGVTAVYCSAVMVYMYLVPISEMARVPENRIATEAAVRMIGPAGGAFIAIAILISTFGCVNGLVLSGARVSYAMAQDGLFFAPSGRLSAAGAPVTALLLQGVWAAALTLSGTYGDLLDYVIFAALLFYALTVAATLRFGARASAVRRGVAIGYIVLAAAVMLDLLLVKPRFTWPGLLIVASGIPVYLLWQRAGQRVASAG